MARAIHYKVPPPPPRNEARDELDQLIRNLHEQGVLRLLNNVVASYPELMEILFQGLNREESQNAVQNVALLATALGQVPPERFVLFTRGITAAIEEMESSARQERHRGAPGMRGAFRMLYDRQLWEGLAPAMSGIQAFSDALHEPPEKPTAKRDPESGNTRGGDSR